MSAKMKFHLRAENDTKTKMDIYFRPINDNESHLIILVFFVFFIHSVTKSALQCAAISPFLQVGLVDGIPLSSCTVFVAFL